MVRRLAWLLAALVVVAGLGTMAAAWRGGYRGYIIHTGSMSKTLVPGDLVIDAPVPGHTVGPGDVITFRHSKGPDLVTHRVTTMSANGIHTKGDANRTADVWTIRPGMVVGVMRWHLPWMGYAVVYLKQPTGAASLVTIGLGLYLLWGLFFPQEANSAEGQATENAASRDPLPA